MSLMATLTVIFIVLKLVGVVAWSWGIVFLPLILGVVIWMLLMLIYIVILGKSIKTIRNDSRFYRKR